VFCFEDVGLSLPEPHRISGEIISIELRGVDHIETVFRCCALGFGVDSGILQVHTGGSPDSKAGNIFLVTEALQTPLRLQIGVAFGLAGGSNDGMI